jgi:hypothetical protein
MPGEDFGLIQDSQIPKADEKPLASDPPARVAEAAGRGHIWMHRFLVLLFVFACAVVGVLLVILPWHPEWTDNPLALRYPGLRAFLGNNFVRGMCSGLGVLDIWIGFWEAVHYHEEPAA